MIKLALIGKNISHSLSPKIYNQLLGNEVRYDLIDCENFHSIPHAHELLKKYRGISITAPYKEHFLDKVTPSSIAQELQAINCLYLDHDGSPAGENTDYLAMLEIVKREFVDRSGKIIVVLGDGAMARVALKVLDSVNLPHLQLSRKINGPLEEYDFTKEYPAKELAIINCCSRDFSFRGKATTNSLYWNLNYAQEKEESALLNLGYTYQDGQELLYLQAKYALAKWQLKI